MLHRRSHQHRIVRSRDARIHQHRVVAQLQRQSRVARHAHARVHNQRHGGNQLAQNAQVRHVLDAQSAADRCAQGHHHRRSGVHQPQRAHRVVARVGQHGEAFLHQHLRRLHRGGHVRVQSLLVADHFDLHPVAQPHFAPQPRRADGVFRRVATGGVGQQKIFTCVNKVQQRFLAAVQVDPAHGHRHYFGAAGFQRGFGLRPVLVLARAHKQAAVEGLAGDDQRVA